VVYLTADQEEAKVIAQANSEVDDKGNFIGKVTARKDGNFSKSPPKRST
jgi:DNA-directed RNA polymerase subunit beta